MLSHSAVLRPWQLELMLQSLSPVLALYDPFGVDVPLNCDNIIINTVVEQNIKVNIPSAFTCFYGD